jgi:hypothetical protein
VGLVRSRGCGGDESGTWRASKRRGWRTVLATRFLATVPAIGSPDPAREMTDAAAGVHCGARERGGVAARGKAQQAAMPVIGFPSPQSADDDTRMSPDFARISISRPHQAEPLSHRWRPHRTGVLARSGPMESYCLTHLVPFDHSIE